MGIVYLAEQQEPVKRQVALKIIKPGMDSRHVMARFEAEQQALALMDHPQIAHVYDAGLAPSGRPYFVMEYVEGVPITEYCDQKKLSTRQRLQLFVEVCHAVQHAHQKGIIHRDIKPSNVLVTLHDGTAVPKIIDFGIAKATSQPLTDKTVFTRDGQMIGTPAYMSPEQAEMSGLDVDTRTDIYALGVLLYELLTGTTPFDPKELVAAGIDQMRRTLCEKEPVRPSTRLGTMLAGDLTGCAEHRQADPTRLIRLVRGDLDWIVMKCLEKDRTRRYATANSLALDIEHHLNNEAVAARPPTLVYRVQKFVRHNQVIVAAATVVAMVLVLGSLVSTWEAIRARQAQREQGRLRQQAETQAYAADMSLAQQALAASNLGRAVDLLNRHRPRPGEQDLRGWEWRYLWQFCQSDAEFTLCEFPEMMRSVAVSADGKWLALYGRYGMVRLWDIAARKEITTIQERGPGRGPLAFSPHGDLLALSADKGIVRLWDVGTQTDRAQLQCPEWARPVGFSADGRRLATFAPVEGSESEVALWDVATARLIAKFPVSGGSGYWGREDVLSSDGGFVAIGGSDGRVRIYETETGKELVPPIPAHAEDITALAMSPDESLLASGAGHTDTTIKLWEVKTGNQVACLMGHTAWIVGLAFSPDGKTLASASADQTIRLWDVDKKQPVGVLRGHRSEVWDVAFLPDGKTLVSAGKDGEVCFWSTRPKPRQESFVMRPISIRAEATTSSRYAAFSMDSQSFVTLDRDGAVVRWDTATVKPFGQLTALGTNNDGVLFSPNGRLLVAGDRTGIIKVWDWVEDRLVTSFMGHSARANPWAFTSDGKILVSGDDQGTVKLWDVASWHAMAAWQIRPWVMPWTWVWSAALSTDNRTLFTGHLDGTLAVTDLLTGRGLAATKTHKDNVSGLALSPDGRLVASASWDGLAILWDVATRKEVARLPGHLSNLWSVTFSPDGQRLATGGLQKEGVQVWDISTRRDVLTLPGQGSDIFYTGFSPDGNMLLAINNEGNLHLWRAPSFAEIDAIEKDKTTDH